MKIALSSLAAAVVVAVPVACAAAPAKPTYDARVKTCQAATKGMYNGETRNVAYGNCLSNTVKEGWAAEAKR
jgi:hypothetical protein